MKFRFPFKKWTLFFPTLDVVLAITKQSLARSLMLNKPLQKIFTKNMVLLRIQNVTFLIPIGIFLWTFIWPLESRKITSLSHWVDR